MITSLFDLDRVVQEASVRLANARRTLAVASFSPEADPPDNPLARFRSTLLKATLDELKAVPDPLLGPALAPHLGRLILDRVLWDHEAAMARSWATPCVHIPDGLTLPALPKEVLADRRASIITPRQALCVLLVDPEDVRRRQIAEAFARAARGHLRDPALVYAERRGRAAAQLGLALDSIDLPAPASAVDAAAVDFLAATAPIAERFAPWDKALFSSMAHGAVGGWPAHLSPRWVMEVFAGTDLGRPGAIVYARLPSALGGMSFARALGAFGEAFGEANLPRSAPFAIARPVVDLRALRIGMVFALLVGEQVFARRTLALGQGPAREHARTFARAWGAHGRGFAAAARTHPALFPPRDNLEDRFCEFTTQAWGEPLPGALAGYCRASIERPARASRRFCLPRSIAKA
ncbi:MAG: hypothetical protein IPK82_14620 [Polyangiaceae bacterium]|nr:hypothetical protein [Polyangiaceae bacterium]